MASVARRAAREALRSVLEALPDAAILVDEQSVIRLANGRAAQLFGFAAEELEGRHLDVLIDERDRARALAALRSGGGIEQLRGVRKDGAEVAVRVCVNAMEPSGVVAARTFVVVARPAVADEIHARLLEGAPDAIVVVESDDHIMLVNDRVESLFGYRPEEVLGRPVEVLVPERFAERHAMQVRGYIGDPHIRPMHAVGRDVLGRRKDGTEFPADIWLGPVATQAGIVVIAAVRDASNRAELEETRLRLVRAEEALRFRDEFVVLVSHELKTPLTAVRLHLGRLGRALTAGASPTELETQLHRVGHALHRVEHLVDELLDVSHVIAGDLVLERERLDLCELVKAEVDRARERLERAGCAISVSLSGPVVGHWDPSRLRQSLAHLLSNAAKYGAGKPIEVAVQGTVDQAMVTVHDEGLGVTPENEGRLFERFARFESARHYGGLGLGLWIVRAVVEAHGGHVEIVRDGRVGTTFRVLLPLAHV